jgi:hypothetical protein
VRCLDLLLRGQIPEDVDPRTLTKVEPLDPAYQDRDVRLAVMDEQGLPGVLLFPTLGCGVEEALKDDIPATMASLIIDGVFKRHPKLRVASIEKRHRLGAPTPQVAAQAGEPDALGVRRGPRRHPPQAPVGRAVLPRLQVLVGPGAPFEVEEVEVRGVTVRSFVRGPATIMDAFEMTKSHADQVHLVFGDERLTFADVRLRSLGLARRLRDDFQVARGDRVAIAMRNFPEFFLAFWGLLVARGDRCTAQRHVDRAGAALRDRERRRQGGVRRLRARAATCRHRRPLL